MHLQENRATRGIALSPVYQDFFKEALILEAGVFAGRKGLPLSTSRVSQVTTRECP